MSEQRVMKEFEELKFNDDFMFCKVMDDPNLCHDVLECLLQRPIGELIETQAQREIKHTSDGKSIRLDVYNEDKEGVVYDAEMQNLNKHSVEYLQLPKRSRFYQSAIDTEFMNKTYTYKMLPESNILFLCTFDPFKKGISKYTFVERCEEIPELELKDGTTKIFYNCAYKGDLASKELLNFYRYIQTGHACNDLTKRIDEAVEQGRKNEMWRSQYMKERSALQEAREEAREEERVNTERERRRAEAAEKRVAELEAQLAAKG